MRTRSGRLARGSLLRRVPAVVLALALAACGSGADPGSGPGSGGAGSGGAGRAAGKVTLRLAWWGSDSRHAYTQKIIDLFEAKHPDIVVDPDYGNFDDYWNKLATGIAGGNAPDVLQQDTKYLRDYAERGAMADLSPYLGKEIAVADLDPVVATSGRVGDKTYGLPTGVNAYAVVADPAAFAAARVPLPDDATWTWERFTSVAASITKGSPKGVYGVQDPGPVDITLEVFAGQRGERLFTPDGRPGLSKATLTAYYTMLAGLVASGAEPPPSVSVEIAPAGVDRSLVATGQGAMAMFWTNQLGALAKAAGKELTLLRLPGDSPTSGTYYKPAMFWSVNARTAHPRESAMLLDFLLNDPEAARLTLSDRGLPANLVRRKAVVGSLGTADQVAARFLEKLRPTIGATPALPPKGSGKISGTVVKKTNEQILFKRLTPEQAADTFLRQAASALKR
ncbi:MAG: pectin-derived oligosaccharide transport system substrate-binding protein [Actinomycetota bacterium]|nr:pectin-derived oligosaccharide transport system substrate-binding protein [Actinomycetota bacterium]